MIDFVTVFNRCLFLTLVHSIWQFAVLAIISWAVGRLLRRSVELNYAINVAALMIGMVAVPVTFFLIGNAGFSNYNFGLENNHEIASKPNPGSPTIPFQRTDSGLSLLLENVWHVPASAKTTILFIFGLASPWVAGLYFAGVAMMLTRLSFAIRRTGLINSHARPLSIEGLDDVLQSLARTWSMKVVPKIALAEQIVVPKVIGLWRSTILLPASAITGLSQEDLKMVLAHELAHVQRYDLWVNLIQRIAESVMFFNPAMWFVSRRIESLREYCCDEKACKSLEAKTGDPNDQPRTRYAMALLRVVELAQESLSKESVNHVSLSKSDLTALAASGRSPSELRRRVLRLFGEPLREPIRPSRGGLLLGTIALLTLVGPAVWQSRADSPSHETVANATSEMPTFNPGGLRYGSDRIDDDVAGDQKNAKRESESGLPNVPVAMKESIKPVAHPLSLSGQVVDESGNPLPNVKVLMHGRFGTKFRGQKTNTDKNGMYQFSLLEAGDMPTSGSTDHRNIDIRFIHAKYIPADGATWRNIKFAAVPTHQTIFNLKMVSRRTDRSSVNAGHFAPVAPFQGHPFVTQFDSGPGTDLTSSSSHTGVGLGRHRSGDDNLGHGIAVEEELLISKLKHRFQNVLGRPGVRKRSHGKQNSKPFQRRPLFLSRRS